jgi:hypothetical protein
MQVAQRSASVTGIGAADGYFTCDRWGVYQGGTAGRLTMTQTADGPSGFANCLKLDCTTADTSIASGEYFAITQRLEGQDVQQIKKGTSDAESITVSFYVKGNASATYAVELFDNDNTRQAAQLFSVTTDWTRVVKTFTPDTTGAFDDDNAQSLQLNFWIHAGSNLTSGTLNQTFAANDNTNRAVGISSFFDSTNRTFFLTGLQMEVGSVATPFEHRSFGEELQLCQRYYQEITGSVDNSALGDTDQVMFPLLAYNTTLGLGIVTFNTPMRGTPAIGFSAVAHFIKLSAGRGDEVTGLALYDGVENSTTRTAYINVTTSTSTAGGGLMQTANTGARLNFDAEL